MAPGGSVTSRPAGRWQLLLVPWLLLAVAASAAEEGGGAGAEKSRLAKALEAHVEVVLGGTVYGKAGEPRSRLAGRALVDALLAFADWGELRGVAALNADSDGELSRRLAPDWKETGEQRRAVEIPELELAAHLSWMDLRLGKVLVQWGVGDGLQPIDALMPRDLTDPLEEERMGVLGAVADLYLGPFEGTVVVARHAPHRLPQQDSRWFPVPELMTRDLDSTLPHGADAWIAGLEARHSGRWLDGSLVVRRGPDLAPHLRLAALPRLELHYPQMTLVGATAAAPRGPLVLRGEVAWRRYDRAGGRHDEEDFVTALAGGERRVPALLFGKDVTFILEAVREWHVGGPRLPRRLAVLDPVRIFRLGLLARARVHNPTAWEVELGAAADLAEGGGLLQGLVRYNLRDDLDLEAGVDVILGGSNEALAPIAENDRAFMRVVAHW